MTRGYLSCLPINTNKIPGKIYLHKRQQGFNFIALPDLDFAIAVVTRMGRVFAVSLVL